MGVEFKFETKGDWEEYDRALISLLQTPNVTIGVGVPEGPHPGQRASKNAVTYKKIAEINEFGDPDMGIPERPVFGPAMEKNEGRYLGILGDALEGVVRGEDLEGSLEDLMDQMVEDVREEIESYGHQPPLAESTIERKGHDQPWIESGALVDAIGGVVQIEAAQVDVNVGRFRDSRGRFKRIRL